MNPFILEMLCVVSMTKGDFLGNGFYVSDFDPFDVKSSR